jgi:short-subunit dehydrogenase involved in D-alanine esterification of teichoic acids
MELKGKTILITGGASGIGLEAAKQFLEIGAKVIITGRNQERLDAAKKQYPKLIAIKSDVSAEEDVKLLFNTVSKMGGIDILYNNAAVLAFPLNLGVANDKHIANAAYELFWSHQNK